MKGQLGKTQRRGHTEDTEERADAKLHKPAGSSVLCCLACTSVVVESSSFFSLSHSLSLSTHHISTSYYGVLRINSSTHQSPCPSTSRVDDTCKIRRTTAASCSPFRRPGHRPVAPSYLAGTNERRDQPPDPWSTPTCHTFSCSSFFSPFFFLAHFPLSGLCPFNGECNFAKPLPLGGPIIRRRRPLPIVCRLRLSCSWGTISCSCRRRPCCQWCISACLRLYPSIVTSVLCTVCRSGRHCLIAIVDSHALSALSGLSLSVACRSFWPFICGPLFQ
jgi:hypothetical protein